jgi:nucleoid-associated protein EbfC
MDFSQFKDLPGLEQIFSQVQKMGDEMQKSQQELETKTVESSAGGGMVKAVVKGNGLVESIAIDNSLLANPDKDMLQDLVVAAVNEGIRRSKEMAKEEMLKHTGGIPLPFMR